MQCIESSPPVRACAPFALALVLAAVHVGQPLFNSTAPFVAWRVALFATFLAPVVIALFWLLRAERYVLTDESLEVRHVIGTSPSDIYALSNLLSVGVAGGGPFGTTVVVVEFRGGPEIRIPGFYAHAGEQFRALFSRLGANIAVKNVV
jgi:hypothetical protein